tara:strand:+ start:621 stop:1202 length:582 start_codon:yes stop_codon:yes gene_type:complete
MKPLEKRIKKLGDALLNAGQKSTSNLDLGELAEGLTAAGLKPIFVGFEEEEQEMKRIVISPCFGGFGLSEKGIYRYAEIKGLTLYPEKHDYGLTTYWVVPPEKRTGILVDEAWREATLDQKKESNRLYDEYQLGDRSIKRDDPILIQVVEELGEKANGAHAELKIVEIPDDVDWIIQEYDGNEWVAEAHRTWG